MAEYEVVTQRQLHLRLPEGSESDWLEFAELPISCGSVSVSDPMFYRDLPPPPKFDMENGIYQVSVKLMTYSDDRRVSRLRLLAGASADLGQRLADVGVDFAQVGVFDPDVLEVASERLTDEQADRIVQQFDTADFYSVAQFGMDPSAIMPFASSGFGDGGYPIHELLRNDKRVGIEIVFIGPEVLAT